MVTDQKPEQVQDADFSENLKAYYSRYFPFKEFYNWLSYGAFRSLRRVVNAKVHPAEMEIINCTYFLHYNL